MKDDNNRIIVDEEPTKECFNGDGLHPKPTKEDTDCIGVSQWEYIGKKYGYWKYFEETAKKEERNIILAKLKEINFLDDTITKYREFRDWLIL